MKIHKTAYFLALLFTFVADATLADFELGSTYYSQGNFESAYHEFLESASYGDHDAQHNIGAMYYRGEFLPKDKLAAYAWMTLATQQKSYLEEGTNLKIYNKFNESEKKLAENKYQALLVEYSDQAIQNRLTPQLSSNVNSLKQQRLLKTIAPNYPPGMAQRGMSGFVDVIFTIDKRGTTRDQMIYYASEKAFGKAALASLRKFQYEPLKINDKPVDVSGIKVRFIFSMDGAEYDLKKVNKIVNEKREKAKTGDSREKFAFGYFLESIPSYVKDYKLIDNPNEWYSNAASEGNNTASYFLGRNILYGNMCTADSNQSMGWLLKAAKAGVTDAEYLLAIESFSGARFEKNEDKGFYWLSKASVSNEIARVKYAWLLATHPDPKRRNGKLAAELLKGFDEDYVDKQSLYQAQAAMFAENGDFAQAVKYQQKALEDAQALEIPTDEINQRLTNYNDKKTWQEPI